MNRHNLWALNMSIKQLDLIDYFITWGTESVTNIIT